MGYFDRVPTKEDIENKEKQFNTQYPNSTILEKIKILEKFKNENSVETVLYYKLKEELLKQKVENTFSTLEGESAQEALNILKYVENKIKEKQRQVIL